MIAEIRSSSAQAMDCPLSNIWVIFQPIAREHYIQGAGDAAAAPQINSHPPIVTIRANAGRPSKLRNSLVQAVAEGVARGLAIPTQNVWIHYQEMKPEDIWFEGRWGT